MAEDTIKSAEQMVELLTELVAELSPEGRKKLGEVIKRNAVIVDDNIVLCDKNEALRNALQAFMNCKPRFCDCPYGDHVEIDHEKYDAAENTAEALLKGSPAPETVQGSE